MTNSYQPNDSFYYDNKSENNDPNLKILENRFQDEKERKLIESVEIKAPHMDRFVTKFNENVILSKKFKNSQLLLNDDPDFISDLIPKKKKKERKLHDLPNIYKKFNHKRKKRKHVIEGLEDLGIYDTSSIKKKKNKYHFNLPVRIL